MDNTNQQIINEVIKIVEILFTIGGALFAIYKTNIKGYLNAKADGIKDESLKQLAKNTIDVIDKLVTTEVTNADIVLKPAIVQAISDGKVTKEELNTLKPIVIDKIKNQLTEDSQKALSSTITNLDAYLDSKVEEVLANLKIDPTSSVSKTVIPSKDEKVENVQADGTVVSDKVVEDENSASSKITVDNPENIQEIGATVNPVSSVVPQ